MKQERERCNRATIFKVKDVLSETQMREILDGVPAAAGASAAAGVG
ncbi:MAG: hypothetical protein NZ823_08120 [Blastocatellia bacterium]|nr:hypothetical protein [Blastocatellia bacterium]